MLSHAPHSPLSVPALQPRQASASPTFGRLGRTLPALALWLAAGLVVGCGDSAPSADAQDLTVGADTGADSDTVSGPKPCITSDDCDGSQVCHADLCRIPCAGEAECAGADLVCDEGRGYCVACLTSTDCGDGLGCRLDEDGGVCVATVCAPDAFGCDDSQHVFTCDASGTTKTVRACAEGQICAEGACLPAICVPGEDRCDGDGLRVCAADGLSESYAPCSAQRACAESPFGCTCVEQACEPRACQPGATRCGGVGVETCAPDGSAWEDAVVCPASESCDVALNACVAATCTPGAASCFGNVLAECNASGTDRTRTDCAASDLVCIRHEDAATCQAPICVPDARSCDSAGLAVETCDFWGAGFVTTPCPEEQVCRDGLCTPPFDICPTAVITVTEGAEVKPDTVLHLSGRDSAAIVGTVTRWEWSVTQPSGASAVFLPSANQQDVTFAVAQVGFYTFRLKVWDSADQPSCLTATHTVLAIPDAAIRVEVLWDTPADADQYDTGSDLLGDPVGSDLDLHLLHADANDQYFSRPFDCNWSNATPDWGEAGEFNDPVVIRDDMDGAGPEIIQLAQPEDGVTYRVGVHYWDDNDFGPSYATIRIYINGELREEWTDVRLIMADLWDAFTIAWPSQVITRINTNGSPTIIPNTSPF